MTEVKKIGTDQIVKILDLLIEGGNVSEKVSQADSVMGKVMALVPLADELLTIMSLSPGLLIAQYKDLDDLEREEINVHVKEKFDIADDLLEAQIEEGVELVGEVVGILNKVVTFSKRFKKKVA